MKKFYPKLRSIQIKTGIWTVGLLLVLLISYLWLNGTLTLAKQNEIRIAFSDVMGLEVGDKVVFRGMEVGRVRSIKASGDMIVTTVRIGSDIMLKEGSRFMVADSSLMGGKTLQIMQGEGLGVLSLTKLHQGDSPDGVMNLISNAAETLRDVRDTIALLKEPDGLIKRSENLLGSADMAVNNTSAMAKDLKSEISEVVARVDMLTASLNEVVQENRGTIQATVAESPAVLSRINSTLDSLQALSAGLSNTVSTLNSGDGTAGMLLNDKQLYDKLNSSVESLDALVKDIKANPRKYVKFSLF